MGVPTGVLLPSDPPVGTSIWSGAGALGAPGQGEGPPDRASVLCALSKAPAPTAVALPGVHGCSPYAQPSDLTGQMPNQCSLLSYVSTAQLNKNKNYKEASLWM